LAVPAQTLRANLQAWLPLITPEKNLISTLKGIEADTHSRMTEIIAAELDISLDQVGLITGPNLAGELICDSLQVRLLRVRIPMLLMR
jgi:glycerol-3-phosphate dehydrogenase (NAD(P)+)